MKAKLTNIYRMTGINTLPSEAVLRLFDDQKQGVQVYLTIDVQPLNDMLLQVAAAKNFGMSVFTGGLTGDTPIERYRAAYELLTKQPPLVELGAIFLVVEVDGEGEGSSTGQLVDLGDIALWVDFGQGAFAEKASFDAKAEAAFHRAVVAFGLTGKSLTPSFQKVGSQACLIDPTTGRRIFPLSYNMSGRATVSSAISSDMAQEIVAQIPAVARATNLDSVVRLLSQSFDERLLRRADGDDDARDLMVFTLVWTSLEKAIGKIYRSYSPPVANLQPQFAAIAQGLNPDNADEDIKKFGRLYQARQDLFHRAEMAGLPAEETRQLLIKYLALHLRRPQN